MEENREVLFVLKNQNDQCILTDREIEYLSFVAMGFTNYEIATALYVSYSTVKKTLETIFDKLLANDRANAVAMAFIHQILNNRILDAVHEKYNLKEYDRFKRRRLH